MTTMETLFLGTLITSVFTVALLIRAIMLKNWGTIKLALIFMLLGGIAGYFLAEQNHDGQFTEKFLGITVPVDVIYIYFGVVLFGLISFIITAINKE